MQLGKHSVTGPITDIVRKQLDQSLEDGFGLGPFFFQHKPAGIDLQYGHIAGMLLDDLGQIRGLGAA